MLTVPDDVDVRKVDLAVELQILSFHEQRKSGTAPRRAVPGAPLTAAELDAVAADLVAVG